MGFLHACQIVLLPFVTYASADKESSSKMQIPTKEKTCQELISKFFNLLIFTPNLISDER